MNIPRIFTAAALMVLCSAAALAQGQQQGNMPPGGGQGGAHHGPPQEALDACKGKKDGDSAQLRTPRGDAVSGVCRLVLVPAGDKNAPPQQPRKDGPPQR
jgi:hypothetical protein